jgi:hypothetical protein
LRVECEFQKKKRKKKKEERHEWMVRSKGTQLLPVEMMVKVKRK